MLLARNLTILVTGFATWYEGQGQNPSWEVARRLPEFLPALNAKDPNARNSLAIPNVRILVHPEAIPVTYHGVRELMPTIWGNDTYMGYKVDMALHIGQKSDPNQYYIEHRARSKSYNIPDAEGAKWSDEASDMIWKDIPAELDTKLNINDVLQRWQKYSPNSKDYSTEISNDAGLFLCEFIYYSSMAELYKQGRDVPVLFWHLPPDADGKDTERGISVATALIRSIVESWTARK